jgi:hypothetical protein
VVAQNFENFPFFGMVLGGSSEDILAQDDAKGDVRVACSDEGIGK